MKYTDKSHPPIPALKVGDIVYISCPWDGENYGHISKCEIRKVEVHWVEASNYEREHMGWESYWTINYYIRSDIDDVGLKSTKMYAYHFDDGNTQDIFLTPQEVMDENIKRFRQRVSGMVSSMRNTMKRLGYTEEQIKKLTTTDYDEVRYLPTEKA